jgi:hypothetical protein
LIESHFKVYINTNGLSIRKFAAAGSSFCLIELESGRVDTIPQAGRFRSVIEDMAEVSIALAAKNLGARHE